jgi:AcrR family transcriptional regulator
MRNADRIKEKRGRVVEAARRLVLRDGLRNTTMESIAREAGMAKPTLYAQFADKNAVFAALLDAFLAESSAAADTGFDISGDVSDRVGEVLARQYLAIARILSASPHADELRNEPARSGFQFQERHFRIETRIAEELGSAGVENAAGLTLLLTASAYGISLKIGDPDAMAAGIRTMCRRIIEPELRVVEPLRHQNP